MIGAGAEAVERANRAINVLSALESMKHRPSLRHKPVLARPAAPIPAEHRRDQRLLTTETTRNRESVTHAG